MVDCDEACSGPPIGFLLFLERNPEPRGLGA